MSTVNEALKNESFSRSSVVIVSTIKAGKSQSFGQYGESFYFITCTGPLDVKTELTGFKPYRKGNGENFPAEFRFSRLEIRNNSASDIYIQLWVGFGEYIDTTAEIVEGFSEIFGSDATVIPALGEVVFDGVPTGLQIQRKQIIISNSDLANSVYAKDKNNKFCAEIFFKSSITITASGYIKFVNNTAADIQVCISELWYVFHT